MAMEIVAFKELILIKNHLIVAILSYLAVDQMLTVMLMLKQVPMQTLTPMLKQEETVEVFQEDINHKAMATIHQVRLAETIRF